MSDAPIAHEEDAAVPDNAEGPYLVVCSCIDCDTCRCIAPRLFSRSRESGYSYVAQQPTTDDEIELMEEAIDCCPVGAIRKADR
jgi:ferredoxin